MNCPFCPVPALLGFSVLFFCLCYRQSPSGAVFLYFKLAPFVVRGVVFRPQMTLRKENVASFSVHRWRCITRTWCRFQSTDGVSRVSFRELLWFRWPRNEWCDEKMADWYCFLTVPSVSLCDKSLFKPVVFLLIRIPRPSAVKWREKGEKGKKKTSNA